MKIDVPSDALLVAELSRKFPTLNTPTLAEIVEFVRCWEAPGTNSNSICQLPYCDEHITQFSEGRWITKHYYHERYTTDTEA